MIVERGREYAHSMICCGACEAPALTLMRPGRPAPLTHELVGRRQPGTNRAGPRRPALPPACVHACSHAWAAPPVFSLSNLATKAMAKPIHQLLPACLRLSLSLLLHHPLHVRAQLIHRERERERER
jgi:hypothetical protein